MELLIAHLMGDYLLQNDWMAQNKKKATLPCLVHVAIYTLAVFLMTAWPLWALAAVAGTHFFQDRTDVVRRMMIAFGQRKFATEMAPWSIILVDNTWHLMVLHVLSQVIS